MLASPTQRHIGAVSEQIECLSVGRQITLGDQDLMRAKRDLLSNSARVKKATRKCCNLRLDKSLSGRLQGLCHAVYRKVHVLPFARLCWVVLVRCQFVCWWAGGHAFETPHQHINYLPTSLQVYEWETTVDL